MWLRLLVCLPLAGFAQDDLLREWQRQFESWQKQAPRARVEAPQWSSDGKTFAYGWKDDAGLRWRLVDCETGHSRPAFDPTALATAWRAATGQTFSPPNWPFTRLVPLADGTLRLENAKGAWILTKEGSLTATTDRSRSESPKLDGGSRMRTAGRPGLVSPDGARRVELNGGHVALRTGSADSAIRLSPDDGAKELAFVGPVVWSPDGRHFALWRERKVAVRQHTVVDSVRDTRKAIDYDKPGDDRTERTPWVFSVDDLAGRPPPADILPKAYATDRLDWSADSTALRTEYIRRGFTGHGILEYGTPTRGWRRLITEEDPKFVHTFGARYRHDVSDDRTIWASERSGWWHLYAVDLRSGRTLHPVTAGDWVMKQVLHLDAAAAVVYFRALGRSPGENPYHQHVCRVGLDGKGLVDLTPTDGHHEVTFSPDMRTLVDVVSRVDLPPRATLRSGVDGRALASLGENDDRALRQAGWAPTRPFVAPDRTGKFDIWGIVTRPHPFDPGKQYPVIENIYAGPHGSSTPRAFNWWSRNHRELASLGFYVVQMDGRGTNHRGKEFHQQSWRDLKDGGFPDRIAWLQALARKEPNLDLSRVGIFGGSAGGQNTAHALLLHGGFYKAGAADCGCYDNRVDKLWWNEQWLGYPVGPWYEENSCARHAANLRGRLFLSVGESDTNVDVKCSYDFRDALLAAGKKHLIEFHVIPGGGHGAGESDEMRVKRARFFESALGKPRPF